MVFSARETVSKPALLDFWSRLDGFIRADGDRCILDLEEETRIAVTGGKESDWSLSCAVVPERSLDASLFWSASIRDRLGRHRPDVHIYSSDDASLLSSLESRYLFADPVCCLGPFRDVFECSILVLGPSLVVGSLAKKFNQ